MLKNLKTFRVQARFQSKPSAVNKIYFVALHITKDSFPTVLFLHPKFNQPH